MHCYELHLDNFKGNFLNILTFFCTLRFQIFKVANIVLFQKIVTLMTGFVVQGHIWLNAMKSIYSFEIFYILIMSICV